MRLAHPWFLLLLILVPALWRWNRSRRAMPPTLTYSDITIVGTAPSTNRVRTIWLPKLLRLLALALIVVAIARPQFGASHEEVVSKGIDIIMVLDNSGSMRVIDTEKGMNSVIEEPTRLEVAKDVINDFVTRRRNDRIGLMKFAGKVYYQCPLTLDYGILLTFLDSIGINEKDSNTAIGDALGTAVLHLKESEAESRVVVLVTDGENNEGILSPLMAADAAKQFGVKVYTVGVGSHSNAYIIVNDIFGKRPQPVQSGLDEETLRKIAQITGARYFRADNPSAMKLIFHKIDELEKTEIKTKRYTEYHERFTPWAMIALLLLGFEVMLAAGPMRQVP